MRFCTDQLDVPHRPEVKRLCERAWRVLSQVHALITQHHVHVHFVDGTGPDHARFVGPDPLIHGPVRVPLQEGVQLDVPAGKEGSGPGPSHDGTGGAVGDSSGTLTSSSAPGR